VAKKLIEGADKNVKNIKKVLGDGAYDTRELFNLLKQKNIEAGIRMRKSASTRSRGSSYRAQCVRERKKLGEKKWKEKHKYGERWAVESYFSAVKRIFGEYVSATSPEGMIKEVRMKFFLYNMLLRSAR